jgi:hypothetical protein
MHIPNHGDFSAFYTSFSYYLLTFYKQCMVYGYLSSMFVTIHVSFSNLPAKERWFTSGGQNQDRRLAQQLTTVILRIHLPLIKILAQTTIFHAQNMVSCGPVFMHWLFPFQRRSLPLRIWYLVHFLSSKNSRRNLLYHGSRPAGTCPWP